MRVYDERAPKSSTLEAWCPSMNYEPNRTEIGVNWDLNPFGQLRHFGFMEYYSTTSIVAYFTLKLTDNLRDVGPSEIVEATTAGALHGATDDVRHLGRDWLAARRWLRECESESV